MTLPAHKTKIICTIGPASDSPEIMTEMIRAGMNVARLNFSHGDFASHARVIENLRQAARTAGRRVAILADLPGPKIRIGEIAEEPITLAPGQPFTLTTEKVSGDAHRVSVGFAKLPQVLNNGDTLFLNDGLIELRVTRVAGSEIVCRVEVGGELTSRKGLNLPGIDLGISAFTDHDRECLRFAMAQGVDAISQSFVQTGADLQAVREAAAALGDVPFLIAKIERAGALEHLEEILESADGLMIARGDLGVEIPIERIAVTQKAIMSRARAAGKPVITATEMLESMTTHRRPTRAEATDVANAILDGTDCVMLSAESAVGRYPVASVAMLARIAAETEPFRPSPHLDNSLGLEGKGARTSPVDLIAFSVQETVKRVSPATVFVPSVSGATVRNIARFRLPVWITAVSHDARTCQHLQFSYGVCPVHEKEYPESWNPYARDWVKKHELRGNVAVLTEGPSLRNPDANHRMEIIDLILRT